MCGKEYFSEGLVYKLNDDGESYTVLGLGECTDTNIIIPATYEGKPVTTIGNQAFRNEKSLLFDTCEGFIQVLIVLLPMC